MAIDSTTLDKKFANEVQARELPPVLALERSELEKKKTLENLISETDPDKKLPRIPQIREINGRDWYVVNLGEPLKYDLKRFIDGKVKELVETKGEKVPSFNVRGNTGLIEDRTARFFVTRIEQLVDGVIKYDSSLQGHFNLLLLSLSDTLQKYVNESIKTQLAPKRGLSGLFSQPSIGKNDKDRAQKIYSFTKGLRELVGGTIRKRLIKIKDVNPHAFKDTFGENYSESIASPLFGGMLENRNGLNPWLYFDVDPAKLIPEDFDQVLASKYQNLTPAAIRKIESVIGDRSKFVNGTTLQSILSDPFIQSQFVVDQKTKKPATSEQLLELKKSLEAYSMFITDLKKLQAIKKLQGKIHSNTWNFKDIGDEEKKKDDDFENSELGKKLEMWQQAATNSAKKLGLISYGVQDTKTFSREQLKSVAYVDLVGSTSLKKELGHFMTDEEMEERQSGIFDIAADLCKQLGIAERNRAGDALVVSGHTALGMAYAMHKLGYEVLPKIDNSLKGALQAKIDHLNAEIRSLNDVGADDAYHSGKDPLEAIVLGLKKEVAHEENKQKLLMEYPLYLRAGISFGKIVEGEHDDIGEVINDASRFTEHAKFGNAKSVSPTDVSVNWSGKRENLEADLISKLEGMKGATITDELIGKFRDELDSLKEWLGKLDNRRGYVITEKFIERINEEALEQNLEVGMRPFEHTNGETYTLLHYKERDGSEIIFRTVGQDTIDVGEIKDTSLWKIVTDPDEYNYLKAHIELKRNPDNGDLISHYEYLRKNIQLQDDINRPMNLKPRAEKANYAVSAKKPEQGGLAAKVVEKQSYPSLPPLPSVLDGPKTVLSPPQEVVAYQAPVAEAPKAPYVPMTEEKPKIKFDELKLD